MESASSNGNRCSHPKACIRASAGPKLDSLSKGSTASTGVLHLDHRVSIKVVSFVEYGIGSP